MIPTTDVITIGHEPTFGDYIAWRLRRTKNLVPVSPEIVDADASFSGPILMAARQASLMLTNLGAPHVR